MEKGITYHFQWPAAQYWITLGSLALLLRRSSTGSEVESRRGCGRGHDGGASGLIFGRTMVMAMAMLSCSSALVSPLSFASGSTSLWKPTLAPLSRRAIENWNGRGRFSLRVRAATQKQKRENVETPNISTPPLPVGSSPVEGASEEAETVSGQDEMEASAATGASKEKELTAEEIGQQLKALQVARGGASVSPDNFWGGVWEETKLVEWPQFKKVLGTTGVVVGIIFGSSILLLTVNAILAELSDQVFNGSSEFAKSWIRGGF